MEKRLAWPITLIKMKLKVDACGASDLAATGRQLGQLFRPPEDASGVPWPVFRRPEDSSECVQRLFRPPEDASGAPWQVFRRPEDGVESVQQPFRPPEDAGLPAAGRRFRGVFYASWEVFYASREGFHGGREVFYASWEMFYRGWEVFYASWEVFYGGWDVFLGAARKLLKLIPPMQHVVHPTWGIRSGISLGLGMSNLSFHTGNQQLVT